ncbi:MAG TPA: response regulator transcription factor [Thermoflexia bacterium]|nr:response regulator transcription factor [Thermoflexia bacterium]
MSERTLRVLIADDQPRVRSALRLLLIQESGVTVVGEAEDVEQALRLVAERQPDLVLLDWELPRWGGPAALTGLRRVRAGLAVIALSGRPEARRSALEAGADGFVSKGDPPERVLEAVRACRRNRRG